MPQIVNLACARCSHRIECDRDAEWCPACGNPVHHQCLQDTTVTPSDASICMRCLGTIDSPIARAVRYEREAPVREAQAAVKAKAEQEFVKHYMATEFGSTITVCIAALGAALLYVGIKNDGQVGIDWLRVILGAAGIALGVGGLILLLLWENDYWPWKRRQNAVHLDRVQIALERARSEIRQVNQLPATSNREEVTELNPNIVPGFTTRQEE